MTAPLLRLAVFERFFVFFSLHIVLSQLITTKMDLNSFNDVASYIATENKKLSQGIMDSFKTEMANIRTDFKNDIDTMDSNLKTTMERVDYEQSSQSSRIARLEDTIARMQRNTEIVISGIPVVVDESCIDLIGKIAAVINYPFVKETIRAFRLNKTGTNRTKRSSEHQSNENVGYPLIMAKFSSSTDKNIFIGKYLAFQNLGLSDIGFQSQQRIFIKENLTPSNYKIFQACASAKRNNQISKYHTRDGICHIALPTSDKLIPIHSMSFLNDTLALNSESEAFKGGKRQHNKRKRDQDSNSKQPSNMKKGRHHHQTRTNTVSADDS